MPYVFRPPPQPQQPARIPLGALGGPQNYNQNMTATLSFTGEGPVRATTHVLAATLSFVGAKVSATSRALTATLSFTGAAVKTAG